jgi:hypothetical protein
MRNDPFWLKAKYPSECVKCHAVIAKGSEFYFYPIGKRAYCGECGKVAEGDFRDCCEMEG